MEQNQEQQVLKCSGDCLKCKQIQWQYCASQFTYRSMRMMEALQSSLSTMQGTIEELRTKIDAIQNSEAGVFNPTESESEEKDVDSPDLEKTGRETVKNSARSDTAQKGDGA